MIDGQKVWTSWAEWSHWCFVLCRTDAAAPKHRGLSYLLVPMRQPGVDGAADPPDHRHRRVQRGVLRRRAHRRRDYIVGAPGDGWKVANGTLAFERGASTLGQNLLFQNELAADHRGREAERRARATRSLRQRLADAWIGLEIMRYNALRMLSDAGGAATVAAPR